MGQRTAVIVVDGERVEASSLRWVYPHEIELGIDDVMGEDEAWSSGLVDLVLEEEGRRYGVEVERGLSPMRAVAYADDTIVVDVRAKRTRALGRSARAVEGLGCWLRGVPAWRWP